MGKQRYSSNNTSKDSLLLSLVTYYEGYHNVHHKYPGDYRNGIRWYDFNPSKWLVWFFSRIGLTCNLKSTPKPIIEAVKASLQSKNAQNKLNEEKYQQNYLKSMLNLEQGLEEQYKIFFESIKAWSKARKSCLQAKKNNISAQQLTQIKKHYKILKKRFKYERKTWLAIIMI